MDKIKNRILQICTFGIMTVFLFGAINLTVRADSITDKGDNDTMETAESIAANNEKPSGVLDGKHEGQNKIRGYVDSKDTDWYKVLLTAGRNYMTCTGELAGSYTLRIVNSGGDVIVTDVYSKMNRERAVYTFTVPEAGYYYVEIQGTMSQSVWYTFMIGSPTYELDICDIHCTEGSVSMTSGGRAQTVHFNGSSITGLPRDAIASTVKVTDIPLNGTSSVWVENDDRELGFSLVKHTWYRENLLSMNLPVESVWTVEFGYNKVISFTPVLRVIYVYPVYE